MRQRRLSLRGTAESRSARPAAPAISAAIVSGTLRAQVITRPAATTIVATPGAPIRPATRSPGNRSRGANGQQRELGRIDGLVHPEDQHRHQQPADRQAGERQQLSRSAVSASEVKRRPTNPDQYRDHDAQRVDHRR